MTIDRRLLAGALGLTLVVAACGGSSTPSSAAGTATAAPLPTVATPATVATEAPAETEEATEAATEEPTEAATEEPGTGSSGQMNSLAEKLPEKAGDLTFERVGFDGDQIGIYGAAAGLNSAELDPILKANGKTINDVNFAVATSTSQDKAGMIYAIQIEGVPATKFAEGMNQDLSGMPKTSMGGKDVYGQAEGGFGFFAYPKDDMLFLILLVDEKTAEDIVSQLP